MLKPGDPAPAFTLPAAHDDGTVSLQDYRGRSAVLLALFRGLYCPFCRHQMAQLAGTAEKLRPLGVETLGIVATAADRARSYFRRLKLRLPLGADPDLTTHRAYGLGVIERTPEADEMIDGAAMQLALALDIPAVAGKAREAISRFDGYQASESDMADRQRHQIQLTGMFLIDRDGTIRWCNRENAATYAVFPSEKQLLPAAERLRSS
jgi:peroxiredoxin